MTITNANPPPHHEVLADFATCAPRAARLLKLLASEQRLSILCRLLGGETSVGELAGYSGMTQSATSQHLAKMKADGLVSSRRDAQTIYYRISDPAAVQVLNVLSTSFRGAALIQVVE
jgi:DNA-binding transcriptional ArsR family regulator